MNRFKLLKKKNPEPPLTRYGMLSDGSFPAPGTEIAYRCEECNELCLTKASKAARWPAFCSTCADKYRKALEG